MDIGEQIKRMRTARGLSQKEVILASGLDKAQFSRIENGKTDPSFSTLEKIAKAMGISLAELFVTDGDLEVDSLDKSVIEKVALIGNLTEDERRTVFSIVDAFVGKRKLRDALGSVLQSVD